MHANARACRCVYLVTQYQKIFFPNLVMWEMINTKCLFSASLVSLEMWVGWWVRKARIFFVCSSCKELSIHVYSNLIIFFSTGRFFYMLSLLVKKKFPSQSTISFSYNASALAPSLSISFSSWSLWGIGKTTHYSEWNKWMGYFISLRLNYYRVARPSSTFFFFFFFLAWIYMASLLRHPYRKIDLTFLWIFRFVRGFWGKWHSLSNW